MAEDEARNTGWIRSDQHSTSLDTLNRRGICDPVMSQRNVSFRAVDMNAIPDDLVDFDFCWSACSLEHLGSISKGEEFLINMLHCLHPGGVAVHTTKYNLSSNSRTIDYQGSVFFRRRDIERIASLMTEQGHALDLDLTEEAGIDDGFIDVPPYKLNPHLRLLVSCFVATSVGIIIQK